MEAKQSFAAALAAVAVIAGLQLVGAQPAGATESDKASCIGIEASHISPPGSSEEFPGGMPQLVSVVHDLSTQFGVAPGAIISSEAHRHAGSHEACDQGE